MQHSANRQTPEDPQGSSNPSRSLQKTSPILVFAPEDSELNRQIISFLLRHPQSSLLAVVNALWPDFRKFPADGRATLWFSAKACLRGLEEAGVLCCTRDEAGVALWTV